MFLLLLKGDQVQKTKMIPEITKYIKQRIHEKVKVTPTILVICYLQIQNMKNKIKAISLIRIDLRIFMVENQWETGATSTSLRLFLRRIMPTKEESQVNKGQQTWWKTQS